MSSSRTEERFKTALQFLAIGLLVLIFSVLLHKGYTDVSRLASAHSGADFWRALARYVLRNMGG